MYKIICRWLDEKSPDCANSIRLIDRFIEKKGNYQIIISCSLKTKSSDTKPEVKMQLQVISNVSVTHELYKLGFCVFLKNFASYFTVLK